MSLRQRGHGISLFTRTDAEANGEKGRIRRSVKKLTLAGVAGFTRRSGRRA